MFSAREVSVTTPDPSCTQIKCHGPLRCEDFRKVAGACRSDVGCTDLNEEQGRETEGATDPETREPLHSQRKGGK